MAFADEAKPTASEAPEAKSTEKAAAETAPVAGKALAFTGEALVIKEQLDALFDASQKVNGATKADARKKIESALDWERVAKSCLGNAQWKKQSPASRNEFQALLKDVVVRTAYSRMDKFWDKTTYTFEKIDIKGSDAHVVSKFNAAGDVLLLEYFLTKKGSNWLIYDISFEDNRYSTNINEQLVAFLREKPFSHLLTNLKKRRDDLASEKPKNKTKSG